MIAILGQHDILPDGETYIIKEIFGNVKGIVIIDIVCKADPSSTIDSFKVYIKNEYKTCNAIFVDGVLKEKRGFRTYHKDTILCIEQNGCTDSESDITVLIDFNSDES